MILAIDPSVNNVGIAILHDTGLKLHTFHPTKNAPLIKKCEGIVATCKIYLRNIDEELEAVIIEYPSFQTSVRGAIAAQKGYTLDLAFICGYVVSAFNSTDVFLPTPSEWKGNLKKEMVGQRFTAWTGIDYRKHSDHEYEAAMIIKWYADNKKRR